MVHLLYVVQVSLLSSEGFGFLAGSDLCEGRGFSILADMRVDFLPSKEPPARRFYLVQFHHEVL